MSFWPRMPPKLKVISVRLTAQEYIRLRKDAGAVKLPKYIRGKLFGGKIFEDNIKNDEVIFDGFQS